MGDLSSKNRIIAAGFVAVAGLLFVGCAPQEPLPTLLPIVTATPLLPTLDTSTPTEIPPTSRSTEKPTATQTPSTTDTPEATDTPELPEVPEKPPTPKVSLTQTATPDPAEGRLPILTMGSCNTAERNYRWGPLNLATRDGFESGNLMMTEWAPMECRPDPTDPIRPPRQLTVAECAVFYYKPLVLVLFPTRPFNGVAYYDDVARLIVHINNYEDEIGLSHSRKVVIGPVSYDGGVIGTPGAVTAMGAGVVDLPDIIQKTRDATGFVAVTDNVHLVQDAYFFGVVNIVVVKAINGGSGVYTIEPAEIPLYQP